MHAVVLFLASDVLRNAFVLLLVFRNAFVFLLSLCLAMHLFLFLVVYAIVSCLLFRLFRSLGVVLFFSSFSVLVGVCFVSVVFFFNVPATTVIYT